MTAQIAIASPELGWGVTEALVTPLLLSLHVPHALLTLCWLFSPAFGVVLHPIVGHLVDVHGRRPFTILFCVIAALGLTLMTASLGLPKYGAMLAVLAFALADTGHDLLLTPTRAAMNDVFDADTSGQRCAIISGIGRVLGLSCAALFSDTVAFLVVSMLLILVALLQLIAPREVMHPPVAVEVGCFGPERPLKPPVGYTMVWILQLAGWMSLCTICFFGTTVWAQQSGAAPGTHEFSQGVKFATLLFTANGVVFIFAGAAVPHVVRVCGSEERALCGALVALIAVLLTFGRATPVVGALGVVILLPMSYQIVANVPYMWVERQPGFDEADRGRLTGTLNASLSVAQTCVALGSGPIAMAAGGKFAASNCAVAAFDVLVLLIAVLAFVLKPSGQADSLLNA